MGSYYNENGLGVGIDAVGNQMFAENREIWEMDITSWHKYHHYLSNEHNIGVYLGCGVKVSLMLIRFKLL